MRYLPIPITACIMKTFTFAHDLWVSNKSKTNSMIGEINIGFDNSNSLSTTLLLLLYVLEGFKLDNDGHTNCESKTSNFYLTLISMISDLFMMILFITAIKRNFLN